MNVTGGVCPNGLDDNDALVACMELGYEHGIAFGAVKLHMLVDICIIGQDNYMRQCNLCNIYMTVEFM